MGEYSLSINAAGSKKVNAQSRRVSELFTYDPSQYRTISYMSRKDGVWCSCGGTSQLVTMAVFDELYAGDVLIKKSTVGSCYCKGTGPDAEDNSALCEFLSWTQAESNAAVAAWAAGTLVITRTVTITKATSSGHGTPTFRDGQYTDDIAINGSTAPFTNYKPTISTFDCFRSTDGVTENVESSTVYARVKFGLTDVSGALAAEPAPRLWVSYMDTGVAAEFDLSSMVTAESLGVEKTVSLGSTWSVGADWNLTLNFSAGEEVADPAEDVVFRAAVPIHISETNNGVAIGQYSSATSAEQKFEVNYPAYFYKGIKEVFEVAQPTMLDGFATPGEWGYPLTFLKIGNVVFVSGTIRRNTAGKTDICEIPDGFVPKRNAYLMCACTGSRLARIDVNPNRKMSVAWYHYTNTTTNDTGTFIWVSLSGLYLLD